MSAFLNAILEEGTREDICYWLGNLSNVKRVQIQIPLNAKTTKLQLFNELVRLYNLETPQ